MLPHRNIHKDTVTSSYGKMHDQIHQILTGHDTQAYMYDVQTILLWYEELENSMRFKCKIREDIYKPTNGET